MDVSLSDCVSGCVVTGMYGCRATKELSIKHLNDSELKMCVFVTVES